MKKLAIFTDCYPYGSSEPFLANELEYLAQSFDEVVMIPLNYGTSREKRAVPSNVQVAKPIMQNSKSKLELVYRGLLNTSPIAAYLIDLIRSKAYASSKKGWSWGIGMLISRTILANKQVKQLLRDTSYDRLYFYWGVRSSFIVPFIARSYSKKIGVRFHGSDTYEETNGGYIPLRTAQLKGATRCYFCSSYGKSYVEKKYPFTEQYAELARLGVHDNGTSSASTDGVFRIVTVSNLVPLKRVDLLAKALKGTAYKVEWTHVGDGITMNEVQAIVQEFPANVKATFTGRLANSQVLQLLKEQPVDLFINVSSSEGVPVSIMEALSLSIPVLATAVGGTPEIVDNQVGTLVEAAITPLSLQKAIETLIESYDLTLRENARKRWEERCNADHLYRQFCQSLLHM